MDHCFEYLTEHCAECVDWRDGQDDNGTGCFLNAPIMECPHFAKMYNEEKTKRTT